MVMFLSWANAAIMVNHVCSYISLMQIWSRYATIVKPSFSEGLFILSNFVFHHSSRF